jgi:Uma2 family endonuclease
MTQVKLFTVEEYFALERASDVKHEYIDGEIRDMPGVSSAHELIMSNLHYLLMAFYWNGKSACRPAGPELQIGIDRTKYTYPDLSVICGERVFQREEKEYTLVNPTLLVEVLSDSTADYDRGDKLALYQSMDTVQQVMHIEQHSPAIDVHTRVGESWTVTTVSGLDSTVTLESIGVTLNVRDIYRDVKFE